MASAISLRLSPAEQKTRNRYRRKELLTVPAINIPKRWVERSFRGKRRFSLAESDPRLINWDVVKMTMFVNGLAPQIDTRALKLLNEKQHIHFSSTILKLDHLSSDSAVAGPLKVKKYIKSFNKQL